LDVFFSLLLIADEQLGNETFEVKNWKKRVCMPLMKKKTDQMG
jgi:hypothetical protein